MIEFFVKNIPKQPPENEEGNKEYKRYLKNKCNDKDFYNKRATQMKYRLIEGNGKAIYMIGIEDDGNLSGIQLDDIYITINSLKKISKIIDANIKTIKIYQCDKCFIATVRLYINDTNLDYCI